MGLLRESADFTRRARAGGERRGNVRPRPPSCLPDVAHRHRGPRTKRGAPPPEGSGAPGPSAMDGPSADERDAEVVAEALALDGDDVGPGGEPASVDLERVRRPGGEGTLVEHADAAPLEVVERQPHRLRLVECEREPGPGAERVGPGGGEAVRARDGAFGARLVRHPEPRSEERRVGEGWRYRVS